MLGNTTANQTATNTGPEVIGTPSDAAQEVEPMSGKGGSQALGGGEDAIPKNSVETKGMIGIEAAALDNRNFIRVIVGGALPSTIRPRNDDLTGEPPYFKQIPKPTTGVNRTSERSNRNSHDRTRHVTDINQNQRTTRITAVSSRRRN